MQERVSRKEGWRSGGREGEGTACDGQYNSEDGHA